jgi:hypothetical protein
VGYSAGLTDGDGDGGTLRTILSYRDIQSTWGPPSRLLVSDFQVGISAPHSLKCPLTLRAPVLSRIINDDNSPAKRAWPEALSIAADKTIARLLVDEDDRNTPRLVHGAAFAAEAECLLSPCWMLSKRN